MEKENELRLVRQAKAGDTTAFAKLYELVYTDMYRLAFYMLKHPEDAADMVSEAVIDAFSSMSNLRSDEAFRGWIMRILVNKCKRKMREYVIHNEAYGSEHEEKVSVNTTVEEAEGVVIRQLFFTLEDEERMLIAMHLFGGYTSREMAQMLDMNENTIRSKQSRALARLKEELSR